MGGFKNLGANRSFSENYHEIPLTAYSGSVTAAYEIRVLVSANISAHGSEFFECSVVAVAGE